MLLDILLAYIETYKREEEIERVAKLLGICFHVLDGEDEEGYQLWSPLTGDKAKLLLEGLVKRKDLMESLFLVGKEREKIISSEEKNREEVEKAHEYQFELIYSLFSSFINFIDYLRDDRKVIKNINEYNVCVQKFMNLLCEGYGNVIEKFWYLHILYSHIPSQLQRNGGSILFASCSLQERLNGKHTHQLLSCIQKQQSSYQLMNRMRREVHFIQNPQDTLQHNKQINPRKKKTIEEREKDIGKHMSINLN